MAAKRKTPARRSKAKPKARGKGVATTKGRKGR